MIGKRPRRGKWFTNRKRNKKKEDNKVVVLREEYEDLYKELLSVGKDENEIEEILTNTHNGVDSITGDTEVGIRIQYSLKDLRQFCPWGTMTDKQKRDALWGIGFDTKKYNFYVTECLHTRINSKRDYGLVVYGSERVDKAWTTKLISDGSGNLVNAASWEARTYYDNMDQGFREDIRDMSRAEMWSGTEATVKKKRQQRG